MIRVILFSILTFLPVLSYAMDDVEPPTDFRSLVNIFLGLINQIIPFLFILTFVTIMWGVIKAWIMHGGEEDSITEGKKIVFAGVIALVVMSGIWGILALLRTSFFGI